MLRLMVSIINFDSRPSLAMLVNIKTEKRMTKKMDPQKCTNVSVINESTN